MTSIIWHPAAEDELVAQADIFAAVDSALVLRFNERLRYFLGVIQSNPLLFHERKHSSRRANLTPKFGEHYLAYILWKDNVVIVALGHAKRKPYYFKNRLGEARRLT